MRKIITIVIIVSLFICLGNINCVNASMEICSSDEKEDFEKCVSDILDLIENPEPIDEIKIKDGVIRFDYDSSGKRVKKEYNGESTFFVYEEDLLVEQLDENTLKFYYNTQKGRIICDKITYNGDIFFLGYDCSGNVKYIYNEDWNVVCMYSYCATLSSVYENREGEYIENLDENFVGNINPFRYQGWYYDKESCHYYLGDGVYYNAEVSEYVCNPFVIRNTRDKRPIVIDNVLNKYTSCLSSSLYGATVFSDDCISREQWQSGLRWYTGLEQTELMARCIYAENNGEGGTNGYFDRVAVTVLIMNRVNDNWFPDDKTPYGAVTRSAQFSTINPGTYDLAISKNTANARNIASRTSNAWKEATLLACTLFYTTSLDDLVYFRSIPNYINDQTMHLSVNSVYDDRSFTAVNGVWKYGTSKIYSVALAGVKEILPTGNPDIRDVLSEYYLHGYNIFFTYKDPASGN